MVSGSRDIPAGRYRQGDALGIGPIAWGDAIAGVVPTVIAAIAPKWDGGQIETMDDGEGAIGVP